jgi:cardiolipin synthase (CMP-forming)
MKKGTSMKIDKKEIISIPNCLGYLRILLIPAFCIVYLRADSIEDYYVAAVIVLISALTDFLDGKIARKFHMITEFGKLIDPVADKLTQGAIALCLTRRFYYMKYLIFVLVLKEGSMLIMGAINLKHGKKLDGAKMYGKICTTSLFMVLAILVFYLKIPEVVANSLIVIEILIMLVTGILYTRDHYKMWQSWD